MSQRCSLVLAIVVALCVVADRPAHADGFALVCNAKTVTSALPKAEIRGLYTGKIKMLGGNVVVVVVRPEDDPTFILFVDQVFGIPAKALLSKIKQEVFKGEMSKPLKAMSDYDVVQQVEGSPGASASWARGPSATCPRPCS